MEPAHEPKGLIHSRKFLQVSFITLLGLVGALVFWVGRIQEERDTLQRIVTALEATKKPKLTLLELLRDKPEALRRQVILSFLQVVHPGADGYEEKDFPQGGKYYEARRGGEAIGYAYYYEVDVDCDVCMDMEIFIGLDLAGKIVGFSPVKTVEHSAAAQASVREWLKRFHGAGPGDRQKLIDSFVPVAGATKTTHQVFEGVLLIIDKIRSVVPK